MIEVDGFRFGGSSDFNNTTKRDIPFPDSSSTPVSITPSSICDDPNNPNYWKENITTQKDTGINVPINQPRVPLTEFAERLIALEQENVALREELEQLKEVISVTFSLAGQSIPLLSQYYGHHVLTAEAAKKMRHGLWEWAKDHGIEAIAFDITTDGLKILKNEEDSNHDTEGTD